MLCSVVGAVAKDTREELETKMQSAIHSRRLKDCLLLVGRCFGNAVKDARN